jgi:hypothetical protein
MNFFQWLFRNPYRMFVHPSAEVERLLKRAGLKPAFHKQDWLWQVALYTR